MIPSEISDARILDRLIADRENEWVEFKTNLSNAEAIGEYISALANSAALHEVAHGYLIWGVIDQSHDIVGTTFDPYSAKVGNQSLIPWLHAGLHPEVMIQFRIMTYHEQRVVMMRVGAARSNPVRFRKSAYIRIDSHTVELVHHPAYEQRLWSILLKEPVDQTTAASDLTEREILELLDIDAYFKLIQLAIPQGQQSILERLEEHRLIMHQQDGHWAIRTHAALLFARNLDAFDTLRRKSIRVVQYSGKSRLQTLREIHDPRGYAIAFNAIHQRIMDLLPSQERIVGARRTTETMLPSLAIREALANALIHQDLMLRGSGPMIEIFDSRVEMTNPGIPLVEIDRLIDLPPRSRNETLASIMRELDFCEERGSGWDKIAREVGLHLLPAPTVDVTDTHTKVTLFGAQPLTRLSKEERAWATYIHSCFLYCQHDYLTNTHVRERFGIDSKNSATATRIITDAIEMKWLVRYDPNANKKMMQYIPYWADRNL